MILRLPVPHSSFDLLQAHVQNSKSDMFSDMYKIDYLRKDENLKKANQPLKSSHKTTFDVPQKPAQTFLREQEVAGSNPVAPTQRKRLILKGLAAFAFLGEAYRWGILDQVLDQCAPEVLDGPLTTFRGAQSRRRCRSDFTKLSNPHARTTYWI